MLFSTYNQGYSFLLMVYAGMLIAVVYDVLRLFRKLARDRGFICGILDAVFWLIACAISLAAFYFACEGEIRLYAVFGLVLGVLVYAFGLGLLVRWLIDRIVGLARRFRRIPIIDAIVKRLAR